MSARRAAGLTNLLNGLGRLVAYYPGLVRFVGSVKGAVLFGQLYYWSERAQASGWFWKTREQLCDETGLTVEELDAARRRLAAKGIVEGRYARREHRLY